MRTKPDCPKRWAELPLKHLMGFIEKSYNSNRQSLIPQTENGRSSPQAELLRHPKEIRPESDGDIYHVEGFS